MGFRFKKSIKLAPGVRINFNKKSASVSFGGKGARYTASSTGKKTASVGLPGTGLSYVTSTGEKKKKVTPVDAPGPGKKKAAPTTARPAPAREYPPGFYKFWGVVLVVLAVVCILLGLLLIVSDGWVLLVLGGLCLLLGVSAVKKSKTMKKPEA